MHESEGGQSSSYFLQFKDSAKQKKLNFWHSAVHKTSLMRFTSSAFIEDPTVKIIE
jgi:hypothetical protein